MTEDLFTYAKPPLKFDGETYEPEHDRIRLTKQALRVWNVMTDGQWRTLAALSFDTGDPEASVSARIRDFRKDRFGNHTVERRSVAGRDRGLYEYRLIVNPQAVMDL